MTNSRVFAINDAGHDLRHYSLLLRTDVDALVRRHAMQQLRDQVTWPVWFRVAEPVETGLLGRRRSLV